MKQRMGSKRESQKTEVHEVPRYQARAKNSSMHIDTAIIRGEAIIGQESRRSEAAIENEDIDIRESIDS